MKSKQPSKTKAVQGNSEADIDDIVVTLKSVGGIEPRVYVPIAWGFILLLILFLVLLLPGIRRNGIWLVVHSSPPDTSILIDGIRLGASNEALFVPKGSRVLTVRRKGFNTFSENMEFPGRVFASRFFPRREELEIFLSPLANGDVFSQAVMDFAAWTATGPAKERYALPPTLTQAARDGLNSQRQDVQWLQESLPLAVDERHLGDILRAWYLIDSGGAPVNLSTLSQFVANLGEAAEAAPWKLRGVLETFSDENLAAMHLEAVREEEINRYNRLAESLESSYSEVQSSLSPTERNIGGMTFISIPSVKLPIGDIEVYAAGYSPRSGAVPILSPGEAFQIGDREVSHRDFLPFIKDNPRWSVENKNELIAAGLVDEGYLSSWTSAGPPAGSDALPLTEVSWFAATAFATWFSAQHSTDGGTFRLPREDEWEIASRLNGTVDNASVLRGEMQAVEAAEGGVLGIKGLSGNVREWCSNIYRYNENRYRPVGRWDGHETEEYPTPDRPVRGGSYIDDNLPYPTAARGGLPGKRTSPVIGFRLVLVPNG